MQNRRTEQRFLCADLVAVTVKQLGLPEGDPVIANLEDISPSGACVQLESRVAEGADIEIICAGCRLRGQVRYCRYVGIGYDTGIAFDSPGAWSRQRYEPAHLLVIADQTAENAHDRPCSRQERSSRQAWCAGAASSRPSPQSSQHPQPGMRFAVNLTRIKLHRRIGLASLAVEKLDIVIHLVREELWIH